MSAVLWCWHVPSHLIASQAGHNLFIVHQTLSLVAKELRFWIAACGISTCPQPLRPPHVGLLRAAKMNYPPEQGRMEESITPLQSPLYSLMLKKNVLEFSPRFLSE